MQDGYVADDVACRIAGLKVFVDPPVLERGL